MHKQTSTKLLSSLSASTKNTHEYVAKSEDRALHAHLHHFSFAATAHERPRPAANMPPCHPLLSPMPPTGHTTMFHVRMSLVLCLAPLHVQDHGRQRASMPPIFLNRAPHLPKPTSQKCKQVSNTCTHVNQLLFIVAIRPGKSKPGCRSAHTSSSV